AQIDAHRMTVERELDASRLRTEGVFDQLLDALETLARIVLERLQLPGKAVGQRQKIVNAAVDHRQLLSEESNTLDIAEVLQHTLERIQELLEAEVLKIKQHIEMPELDVQSVWIGNVGPRDGNAGLRIQREAGHRSRQHHWQSQIGKARDGGRVHQAR